MFVSERRKKIHRTARSQSLVEFSLSLILLLTLLSGLLDLGRAYFVFVAVADVAGEGALFLATNPKCYSPSIAGCDNPNNVQYRMQAAGGALLDMSNAALRIEYSPNGSTCVYYTATASASPGTAMPALQKDAVKSPAGCSSTYTYTTTDDISVQLTYTYALLTPVISAMVPLVNGQHAVLLYTIATQQIVVK